MNSQKRTMPRITVARTAHAVYADSTPSTAEVKAGIDRIGAAFEQFKAANDDRLNQIETKMAADVVTTEKVDRINTEITTLQSAVDETAAAIGRLTVGGGGTVPDPEAAAYTQAFNTYFRRGNDDELRAAAAAQAAATTQSEPDGGFLVPEEMETTIDRVLGTMSTMRALATVRSISAGTYKKIVNVGGTTSGWVGETDPRGETGRPKLEELAFNAMELYAMPLASQTLLDDARVNIEQWLGEEVSTEFAEQEGAAFIAGDGVNKPRGILQYQTVDNAAWAWGKIGFLKTGVDGAFPAANPSDLLIDVIYAIKQGYRQNATWIMNRFLQAEIRKFKDANGQYLWQPAMTLDQPATLLNYPIADDDNMPDAAVNSLSLGFGDFQRGYMIVDRFGIRVLRDPFSTKPYVSFYTTKRVGGGVQNFEAFKLVKFAA